MNETAPFWKKKTSGTKLMKEEGRTPAFKAHGTLNVIQYPTVQSIALRGSPYSQIHRHVNCRKVSLKRVWLAVKMGGWKATLQPHQLTVSSFHLFCGREL